ncbi:MAG: beta strand repeat-containing protein, partial [Terrimicrobiaceae bacterium]
MKKNIISSSSLAIALLLGASLSASAQYTTFNNSGNFTWNAAPWSAGVPSISPSLSGLIKGGGTITIDSTTTANATALIVGWTGNGTLNVTGGNLTVTGGGEKLTIGASADNVSGILNQSGGTVTAPTVQFALGGFSVLSGTYNLNGGTLAANNVLMHTSNGTGNFNFNGGTLRSTDNGVFSVNATQAVTATVQSGGAIFDTNGFTLVVNSALANGGGGGGLAKNGAGTLTLNATNAYTGATSINAGTLQLGNGGTAGMLSTSSAITNNGTLAINRSDAVVQGTDFSGAAISGTGLFRQAGSGNTTLNIANTYTGGTTLAAGTVIVSAANALSTSGNITFTGGTLQFNSGGVQDYSARIKNSTSAIRINTNGNNATFAGTIDSTNNAGLTKSGLGTLTLNATNNTYTGLSTVSAGTLQIGNSELSDNLGNSSFTVATGATLAFNRNANTTKFTNQSISGAGDVVFNGQSLGFYTFLPDYTGTLTNTGKTIV